MRNRGVRADIREQDAASANGLRTKAEHAGGCQRKKERVDLWRHLFQPTRGTQAPPFTGQPSLRAARLAGPAQDHRLDHGDPILQPGIQGRRQGPQAGKEKGRREGPYGHWRKRGRAWRHQVHLRGHPRQFHAEAREL